MTHTRQSSVPTFTAAPAAASSQRHGNVAGTPAPNTNVAMQLALHSAERARQGRDAGDVASEKPGAQAMAGPRLPIEGVAHSLATRRARPGTYFRLPVFADLKAAFTDKKLKIPEAVIKDRVGRLLGRMEREKRLKSKDSVPTIVGKIFPGPGVINETEFNNAIDVADRTKIYKSVLDADTVVKAADKPGLKTAMADAITLMKKVEGDAAGLKAVFGGQDTTAKANYAKAQTALGNVAKDLDKHVTTDYNLDDPEVDLGGWAQFSSQNMHLIADVVQLTDPKETKSTLIHESSHLADPSVTDKGYYGSPNFEALSEAVKVTNAAHYEELPKRDMLTSKFAGITFTPGKLKGGAAPTWEDGIRRTASEALREGWDAAVDVHNFIRKVRKDDLAGTTATFTANKVLILEISKLMDLTVHEQDPANMKITALDVTLTESIAHGIGIVGSLAQTAAVTAPPGPFATASAKDKATTDVVIADSIAKYGKLLGNAARDKTLVDWMTAHVGKIP
ncbi:MAG: hypothetical protein M3081_13030 [Gemmatimonadota bacterium]|nr:hypothetical protein [Gemmatimonadota bacterium]